MDFFIIFRGVAGGCCFLRGGGGGVCLFCSSVYNLRQKYVNMSRNETPLQLIPDIYTLNKLPVSSKLYVEREQVAYPNQLRSCSLCPNVVYVSRLA